MSAPVTQADQLIADMNTLRNMLGVRMDLPSSKWCYRNYFNAEAGHHSMPSLDRLELAGLIEHYRPGYYRATWDGCRAIGLTEKQSKRAMEL